MKKHRGIRVRPLGVKAAASPGRWLQSLVQFGVVVLSERGAARTRTRTWPSPAPGSAAGQRTGRHPGAWRCERRGPGTGCPLSAHAGDFALGEPLQAAVHPAAEPLRENGQPQQRARPEPKGCSGPAAPGVVASRDEAGQS